MPRIGITGHSSLSETTAQRVAEELRTVLSTYAADELVGLTCLARGADQIFARVVIELGGSLEVVLPAADYRERKVKPDNAAEFDALIAQATAVHTMPLPESNREAYLTASEHILAEADEIVAVWDGAPPDGKGGTGDVVRAAREQGTPVTVVWPEGATRR
ncbi:hypothetical protein [Actinophytocola sp. KF-1]